METIDQQVINDNKEIYVRIQSELLKAKSEILIATAWFTDEDLFNILSVKLDEGLHIEIIIADNQENEKLNFDQLASKGAAVFKIKNIGYGIMNQKFCVIDRRIALHGSYNWTINAKKNNHESIISTDHKDTINSLLENFSTIRNRILELKGKPIPPNDPAITNKERPKGIQIDNPLKASEDFEKVLDYMIAAEVGNFDRKLLREHGFNRSAANNGDHQVLHSAFDSLYFLFINDIDIVDDKKKSLIAKIEEHRIKSQNRLNKECDLQIDQMEKEHSISINNLQAEKNNKEKEVDIITKSIDDIKGNKIPFLEKQNTDIDKQIKEKEIEFIRPRFKWFEFIPVSLFTLALLIYLFIFYSSAAYILLFSVEEAKIQQTQGIPLETAQIFNPDAVNKALEKNWTATLFIFLFVFIPLSITAVDRFVNKKYAALAFALGFLFGIVLLDGAIAYKVTEAIYTIKYLQGDVNIPWTPGMAFIDTNFYLVFVFGAFGLLLFKLSFKKLLSIFEDRSPDTITQRSRLLIKQLKDELTLNIDKINLLKDDMLSFEKNIIQLKSEIKNIDLELADRPKTIIQEIQKKRSHLLKDLESIDHIAGIYTQRILSDNLPISIDALKDRINIFLEGWNDFLHKHFAVELAKQKSLHAAEVSALWQSEKITVKKIDKRVKVNHDN